MLQPLTFVLALSAPLAHAETVEECVRSALTRGSETSKRTELNKRCDNTRENHDECKRAAKLVQQAVEEHQRAVRATCEKQAANVNNTGGQNKLEKNASTVAGDAKSFTEASAAKLDATNRIATKGKGESEKAVNMVIDDPQKVKPSRKPIIEGILKTFKDSDYSGVTTALAYAQAMRRIDEAWKQLQSNPDMAQDRYADAYEATATYLNAEEVRLGTAYQKNQMITAASSLQDKASVTDSNSKNFGDNKDGNGLLSSASKTLGLAGAAAGAAGAIGALTGNQSASLVTGVDPGASAISAGATSLSSATAAEGLSLATNKGGLAHADGAASQLSGEKGSLGSIAPYSEDSGVGATTGASKADTSLRDSLRKKLMAAGEGDDDLTATAGKPQDPKAQQAAAAEARMAQTLAPEAPVVPGFVMPGSETDAAVKDLLAGFSEGDKAENAAAFGLGGGEDGRRLAGVQSASPGVEGRDSTNLFSRVRAKVVRCVKKGYVTNGISNEKI